LGSLERVSQSPESLETANFLRSKEAKMKIKDGILDGRRVEIFKGMRSSGQSRGHLGLKTHTSSDRQICPKSAPTARFR
jgi:hypothetical protein